MPHKPNSFSSMVCLVGENPLPVYLGIRQWAEPNAEIILVHSGENGTGSVAERIGRRLQREYRIIPYELTDPFSPYKVYEKMEAIAGDYPNAVLNYTGGTKVMSSFGVSVWRDILPNSLSFYLEEGGGDDSLGAFHFDDDPTAEPLKVNLSLSDLTVLHKLADKAHDVYADYDAQDLRTLWDEMLANRIRTYRTWGSWDDEELFHFLRDQYDYRTGVWKPQSDWNKFLDLLTEDTRNKWLVGANPPPATFQAYKDGKQNRCVSDFCLQVEFVTGKWLELLMKELALGLPKNAALPPAPFGQRPQEPLVEEARAGQDFEIKYNRFEADVVMVVNHCLRYVSVTTSSYEKLCKSKMFEAIHRSQQIGGGLARSCVVCSGYTDRVNRCRTSVGTKRHTIFGIDDIQAWMNGDVRTLRKFLTE